MNYLKIYIYFQILAEYTYVYLFHIKMIFKVSIIKFKMKKFNKLLKNKI